MMKSIDTKIVLLACIGMFITVLNFGIINVALPSLQTAFHTTTTTISWTVSIYVLLLSCTILLFGKLGDKLGKMRIYGYGFIIFFIGSLVCISATNVGMLITARALQGLGAAMIQANAFALISSTLPEHKRVKALSLLGMAMGLGPILGPALGGVIVSFVSWRWVFFINLPICIWGFMEARAIKDDLTRIITERLPVSQLTFFSLAIASFFFGLFNVSRDNLLAGLLVLGAILLVMLYLSIEKRSLVNIVPLSLFSQVHFSMPLIGIMIFGFCSAVIFVLPPFMFENYLHFSAWQVGLISLLCPLGFLIGSQLTVNINRYMTMEQSTLLGLVLMLVSLVGLFMAQAFMSLTLYYCMLFLFGLGGVLFQIVGVNMIMTHQQISLHGTLGAIIRMFQNITVAIGATLTAMLMQHFNKGVSTYGYTAPWALAAVLALVAVLMHAVFLNLRSKQVMCVSADLQALNLALANDNSDNGIYRREHVGMSAQDFNVLTYREDSALSTPRYTIIAQDFSDAQTVFRLKVVGENDIIEKTAADIYSDASLLAGLSSKDAHMIGYVSASEKMFNDIAAIAVMKIR